MGQSRDEDEVIFADVYPRLRAFASVIGPRSVDPDDLVQEALMRTLQKHRLTELDQPLAYLRRAVHNLSIDRLRAEGRQRTEALGDVDGIEAQTYPSDLADLEGVSEPDRALLYLIHIEGATYAEASEVFDASEAALRQRSSRALMQLRRALAPTPGGSEGDNGD